MLEKLWIRADGNEQVAMGHIMRCLTIACACRKKNMEVQFLLADDSPAKIIEERGFTWKVLHTDYRNMEEELPYLREILTSEIERRGSAWKEGISGKCEKVGILVDSYFATDSYLKKLQELAVVIYMDDLAAQAFSVDMVINYNHYAVSLPYDKLYADRQDETNLLLGCGYAPLREEFALGGENYVVREEMTDVLVSTGGGDRYNVAAALFRAVKEEAGICWHVICGPFNKNYKELKELSEEVGEERLCIHCNVKNMAELMQKCDAAVAATGSTIYELCAVGVPTVSYYFADNQRMGAEGLERLGILKNAGDYSKEPEQVLATILAEVKAFRENRELRKAASNRMRGIVDGRGAERIAEALLLWKGQNGR